MRRVLAANGQTRAGRQPALELNVTHPLVRYLDAVKEAEPFGELALLLYDQATLADEGQIANRTGFQPPARTSCWCGWSRPRQSIVAPRNACRSGQHAPMSY